MKIKIKMLILVLAAGWVLQACAVLPASGSEATAAVSPQATASQPGVTVRFPTGTPADCSTTAGPTQSADCSGGVVDLPGTPAPSPDVEVTQVVSPQPDGSLVLTLEDQNKYLVLPVGGSFLLKLGEVYDWTISVADPNIISREPNVTVIKGAQGIYLAHKVGMTVLSAAGDPVCRQSKPACGMPSILVSFNIEVKP
jgi:hypothetical protein